MTDWRTSAACLGHDSELFFPTESESAIHAKRICHRCPVVSPCLDFALKVRAPNGVFGATTVKDRRRLGVTPSVASPSAELLASERDAAVLVLCRAGWTDEDVGRRFGITKSGVGAIRERQAERVARAAPPPKPPRPCPSCPGLIEVERGPLARRCVSCHYSLGANA